MTGSSFFLYISLICLCSAPVLATVTTSEDGQDTPTALHQDDGTHTDLHTLSHGEPPDSRTTLPAEWASECPSTSISSSNPTLTLGRTYTYSIRTQCAFRSPVGAASVRVYFNQTDHSSANSSTPLDITSSYTYRGTRRVSRSSVSEKLDGNVLLTPKEFTLLEIWQSTQYWTITVRPTFTADAWQCCWGEFTIRLEEEVVCGDGKVGSGESCDNGESSSNSADEDGCTDDTCKVKDGWTCNRAGADSKFPYDTCTQTPIDCVVGDWTEWSECSDLCTRNGIRPTRRRTREVITGARNGGKQCPDLVDQESCNTHACIECGSKTCTVVDAECTQYTASTDPAFRPQDECGCASKYNLEVLTTKTSACPFPSLEDPDCHQCVSNQCTRDSDCTKPGDHCYDGACECKSGFDRVNGTCSDQCWRYDDASCPTSCKDTAGCGASALSNLNLQQDDLFPSTSLALAGTTVSMDKYDEFQDGLTSKKHTLYIVPGRPVFLALKELDTIGHVCRRFRVRMKVNKGRVLYQGWRTSRASVLGYCGSTCDDVPFSEPTMAFVGRHHSLEIFEACAQDQINAYIRLEAKHNSEVVLVAYQDDPNKNVNRFGAEVLVIPLVFVLLPMLLIPIAWHVGTTRRAKAGQKVSSTSVAPREVTAPLSAKEASKWGHLQPIRRRPPPPAI